MAPCIIRNRLWDGPTASYKSFYSLQEQRSIQIKSPLGQAQYILSDLASYIPAGEWLLLCRFANTVTNEQEVQELLKLGTYIYDARFESRNGYVRPKVAREVEKEIILRTAAEYAVGWDMTPALRLLAEYESVQPIFTQPERNLMLRYAFSVGNMVQVSRIAKEFTKKRCTRKRIVNLCEEIDQVELGWAGLTSMDGISYTATCAPGSGIDFRDCESESKFYPPFAQYPALNLPIRAVVLSNGILLFPVSIGWWRSGLRKVDQTFAPRRYYKLTEGDSVKNNYQIADREYSL